MFAYQNPSGNVSDPPISSFETKKEFIYMVSPITKETGPIRNINKKLII
jgi:hypothetical protein